MIVFIATRPHHVDYFESLSRHLSMDSRVERYPRLPFDALLPSPPGPDIDVRQLVEDHMSRKLARNRKFTRIARASKRLLVSMAARSHLRHFRRLAASRDTDAIAVWNGFGWVARCAVIAARASDKPVIHFENGLLPGTTTIDAAGVNALNSIPRNPETFRALWPGDDIPLALPPSAPGTTEHNVPLPPRYIWVPFQIDSDSQIIRHSPWIANMRALFAVLETLSPLAAALGLVFVCKEHPSSTIKYPDLHQRQSANLRIVNSVRTDALIHHAAGVITINSTAGLEALLMYKPVIALGEAFYAMPGLADRGRSVAEVAHWLVGLPGREVDRKLVNAFHHYLRSHYCVAGSWKSPDRTHLLAAAQRVSQLLDERSQPRRCQ